MYSGFMPIDRFSNTNEDGSLFFWLVNKKNDQNNIDKKNEKLIIWLNGGNDSYLLD